MLWFYLEFFLNENEFRLYGGIMKKSSEEQEILKYLYIGDDHVNNITI